MMNVMMGIRITVSLQSGKLRVNEIKRSTNFTSADQALDACESDDKH